LAKAAASTDASKVRTDWHGTDISWFADRQRWPWPGLGGLGMVIAER
jgi:hypothetical protein